MEPRLGQASLAIETEEVEHPLEVVVAVVFDLDFALLGAVVDDHVGGEIFAQAVGNRADLGICGAAGAGFGAFFDLPGALFEGVLGQFFVWPRNSP